MTYFIMIIFLVRCICRNTSYRDRFHWRLTSIVIIAFPYHSVISGSFGFANQGLDELAFEVEDADGNGTCSLTLVADRGAGD